MLNLFGCCCCHNYAVVNPIVTSIEPLLLVDATIGIGAQGCRKARPMPFISLLSLMQSSKALAHGDLQMNLSAISEEIIMI